MAIEQPRLSKEEFSQRGHELYERIRPKVEDGNRGRVVAIDVESGDFEVGSDTLVASDQLLARIPNAQTWFERIGYPALHRFGPRIVTST
jgi:hypothetical protein